MAQPAVRRTTNFVRANKDIIGTKVVNPQNEDLGKIEDLIVDSSGRISYAVLSFGGFLGLGDKDFAIPFNAFAFDAANNRAVLNIDKSLLKNAPGFDKNNWPNLSDPSFGQDISRYYGYDHVNTSTFDGVTSPNRERM
jgi:PRC-barrel domain